MKINPMYALPNLFTAASIFVGMLSMISAINGDFIVAGWLILFAMIFDGLDGRVARMTNTASKFGVELDSLADIISFGVAPAMLVYLYVGVDFEKYGVVVAALMAIFGALRLARFNVTTTNADPYNFIGLPIPSAAVFLALWVIIGGKYFDPNTGALLFEPFGKQLYIPFFYYQVALLCGNILVAILMVSNVRYPSFKKLKWGVKSYAVCIIIALYIFVAPALNLTILMTLYIIYGLLRGMYLLARSKTSRYFR